MQLLREKNCYKNVRFSETLSKLFPEADEIFDNQKIDDDFLEIKIPNTQRMFKELNDRKLPEDLNFLGGGNGGGNELKFHTMLNVEMLSKSNEHFLFYFYRQILLAKFHQKIKSQQDETKKNHKF